MPASGKARFVAMEAFDQPVAGDADARYVAQRPRQHQPYLAAEDGLVTGQTAQPRMPPADQARQDASAAREEAARLAGQLDTLKEQSAALLARITPPAAEAKPTRKKPGGE